VRDIVEIRAIVLVRFVCAGERCEIYAELIATATAGARGPFRSLGR
jgi:hypothetical protein